MDMRSSITPIILAFVGLIVVGSVLVPLLLDLVHEPDVEPGDSVSYTPDTNIPATFTYSGTIFDHADCIVQGNTIDITFRDEGIYTLVITATSQHPYQEATQTVTVEVGQYGQYHDYKPLLLLIPTMFLVGFMLLVLGRRGGEGGEGFGVEYGGEGPSISGRIGGGFGGR